MKKSLILLVTLAFFGAMSVYAESTDTTTSASSDDSQSYQTSTSVESGDMMKRAPRFERRAGSGTMTDSEMEMKRPSFGSGAMTGTGDMMRRMPHPERDGSGAMMGSGKLMRQEIETLRKKAQADIKANREQQRQNLKDFRESHSGGLIQAMSGTLTDDQKTALKTLLASHKIEMDALVAQLKAAKGDETTVASIQSQIDAAREAFLTQIKSIVGDNADLSQIVDDRMQVFQENKSLREDNQAARQGLQIGIQDKVVQYKDLFIQRISSKVNSMTADQVQKIIDVIDAQITKVEANKKLSDDNKNKLKAQLVALREILSDRLNTTDNEQNLQEVQSMIQALGQ